MRQEKTTCVLVNCKKEFITDVFLVKYLYRSANFASGRHWARTCATWSTGGASWWPAHSRRIIFVTCAYALHHTSTGATGKCYFFSPPPPSTFSLLLFPPVQLGTGKLLTDWQRGKKKALAGGYLVLFSCKKQSVFYLVLRTARNNPSKRLVRGVSGILF